MCPYSEFDFEYPVVADGLVESDMAMDQLFVQHSIATVKLLARLISKKYTLSTSSSLNEVSKAFGYQGWHDLTCQITNDLKEQFEGSNGFSSLTNIMVAIQYGIAMTDVEFMAAKEVIAKLGLAVGTDYKNISLFLADVINNPIAIDSRLKVTRNHKPGSAYPVCDNSFVVVPNDEYTRLQRKLNAEGLIKNEYSPYRFFVQSRLAQTTGHFFDIYPPLIKTLNLINDYETIYHVSCAAIMSFNEMYEKSGRLPVSTLDECGKAGNLPGLFERLAFQSIKNVHVLRENTYVARACLNILSAITGGKGSPRIHELYREMTGNLSTKSAMKKIYSVSP
jgi:hypothetical protein